ncbi:MAG: hypothetical protein ABWX67_17075 [Allosphingosinicella sp.]
MRIEGVGDYEASDIDRVVSRLLRDIGEPEPPLSLEMVREALKLDVKFYSSAKDSIVEEIAHRVKVGAKQILLRPGLIVDAIKKANLSALWMPDRKRILIDDSIPRLKHRWIEGHEIGHSLIPWHKEFLFGDTEYTLDPACHAMVEAEANYAAGQLLFLRGKFGTEARDLDLDFASIKAMAKRYGNTITSTLWRMIEERNPDQAVFGMVSCHPNHPSIGAGPDGEEIRYFIRSERFRNRFANVTSRSVFQILRSNARWSKRGTIVDCTIDLKDADGEDMEFRIESFSNGYALLTYGVMLGLRRRILAAA